MNDIFNHLWQSTAFAAAVALATVPLRRNSPRLRYWLWLAASMKFLVPFFLLVSTGARVQFPPDTPSLRAVTVQQISTYFAPITISPVPSPAHAVFPWASLLTAIWLAGALFLLIRWFRSWRRINVAAREGRTLEPGVFGLFRPVLLLPAGLADLLTGEQLQAVLAHEARHVECFDNLTAALHMCVETLFWFHPLVWWIGARLMEERERDCDEAVLMRGNRPTDYARGIVQVCEVYIESPLACASGISGSDLKKRIREIMSWRGSLPVTLRAKAMLAAATFTAVSIPFVIGALRAQTLPPPPAYTYDVVSIHKSDPAEINVHISDGPQGGLRTTNTSVLHLLAAAYKVEEYQIAGAPHWADTERFDVMFTPDKTEPTPADNAAPTEWDRFFSHNLQRLQAVLRDRFGLVLRAETRELPIYVLRKVRTSENLVLQPEGKPSQDITTNNGRQISGRNATMQMLANQLSMDLRRPVRNETHIEGRYDFKLDWVPDPDLPEGSVFTEITNQLGLRLESAKGPAQVYVIEKLERPTEN